MISTINYNISDIKNLFLRYYDPKSGLTPDEISTLLKNSSIQNYKKNEIIAKSEEPLNNMIFIVDGIIRTYLTTPEKEVTYAFYNRYKILGDIQECLENIPSQHSLQAIKNTTVLLIPFDNIRELLNTSLSFNKLMMLQFLKYFTFQRNKENYLIGSTAFDRVLYFIKTDKELYESIPDMILASYIGCTSVQLSRLNKKVKETLSKTNNSHP